MLSQAGDVSCCGEFFSSTKGFSITGVLRLFAVTNGDAVSGREGSEGGALSAGALKADLFSVPVFISVAAEGEVLVSFSCF